MINQIKNFLKEVIEEKNKISYPDKNAVKTATISIIFIVFFVAFYMEILDLLFKAILKFVFGIYN